MSEPMPNNSNSRPRLGRGLAALLGEATAKIEGHEGPVTLMKDVPIEFLRSNLRNPRQHFDETELDELTASIRERGILQPIIVRPIDALQDAYEIVAGERRWRAAQRAGKHTVPIISLSINDREALEISIIENVQRADLNALEEANGYANLASDYGYSHTDIGRVVGKSRSHIANTLRLLALPETVQKLLTDGFISAGHARALLTVERPHDLANQIVENNLSVREVEQLANSKEKRAGNKAKNLPDAQTEDLANRLSLALGTTAVILNGKRIKEIRIKYSEFEQLDYICNKLLSIAK